jgi:porin
VGNDQPSTRLFTLWFQQNLLEDQVSFRIGQLAADDEFVISPNGSVFINSTFGWPGIFALDLPSGGPAYPLSAPGMRLRIAPTDTLSFQAAVFSGDPAGNPGTTNPQIANASGTTFSFNGGAFVIAEAIYAINQPLATRETPETATAAAAPAAAPEGLPGTYRVGGWYHTGTFADLRSDTLGLSLADPASSGTARSHEGNYGFYLVADQMVWRVPGTQDQGLSLFTRVAGSPGDRNLVSFYVDGGATYRGLIPDREQDILGLAFAYAVIGNGARNLDRDLNSFNGLSSPVRSAEVVVELTYQAQIAPWWIVQPDLQYVVQPGGNVPDPTSPDRVVSNAFVLGVRTTFRF